jgi:hypothetical protein
MLRTARRHLSANLVAYLALFVALGGTSYAAVRVTGKNVADGSLTGADLKNSSVTGKDVKNRSLKAADFATGQLPAGPQGAPGPKGDQGPAGPVDPSQFLAHDGKATDAELLDGKDSGAFVQGQLRTVQRSTGYYVGSGTHQTFTLSCPAGTLLVRGRYSAIANEFWPGVTAEEIYRFPRDYDVKLSSSAGSPGTLRMAATCLEVAEPPLP